MQTFLPYPNFAESARVLDKRRCWKQVIEAKQIIDLLVNIMKLKVSTNNHEFIEEAIRKLPWINHPTTKMWRDRLIALEYYFDHFLQIAIYKHHINTKYKYILQGVFRWADFDGIRYPWWFGNEDFHRAMRARLIEKDRDFYLPLWPEDEGFNGGKYLWPVMETKTFRTI